MIKWFGGFVLGLAVGVGGFALAQQLALPVAIVVTTCGASGLYLVDRSAPLTVDTNGQVC